MILMKLPVESLIRNGSILDMVTFSHFCTTKNSVWAFRMLMVMASLTHVHVHKMDQQLWLKVTIIALLKVLQSCVTMELLKQHYLVSNHFAEDLMLTSSGLVLLMKI